MDRRELSKRLIQIIIVLFGVSFLTFGLVYLSPGDPAEIMLTGVRKSADSGGAGPGPGRFRLRPALSDPVH